MTRTSAWLAPIAIVLAATACRAQEGRPRRILLPRLSGRPSQVWAADAVDQPGAPQGQALPPPTQDTRQPARGTPVLFPADPFPPPAPPVLDPRTLAWQQVHTPYAPGQLPPGGAHHGVEALPEVPVAPVRPGFLGKVLHRRYVPAASEVRAPYAPAQLLPPGGSPRGSDRAPEAPAALRRAAQWEPPTQTPPSTSSTCSGPYGRY
jgi:hypothetical protein